MSENKPIIDQPKRTVTFVIETGKPDSNGDIINLDGIKIPEKVLLTSEFNHSQPLGFATIEQDGDVLKATAEVPGKFMDRYPAIGFQALKYHMEGNIRVFDEIKLHYVSLCESVNVNPEIKTIREQTKSK